MSEEDIDRYIEQMLARMTQSSLDGDSPVTVPDVVLNAARRARAELRSAKEELLVPTSQAGGNHAPIWREFELRAAAGPEFDGDTGDQMATLWSADGVFLTCLYHLNWQPGDPPIALMLGCREDRIAQFRGQHIRVVIGDTEIDMGECDDEGKVKAPWPPGLRLRPRFLYRKEDDSGGELR